VGETLQSRMIYRKSGASDYTRTSEQTYDHVGRLKDSYYTLTEGTTAKVPRLLMSSLLYDNIGRIKTKFIQPQANLKASKSSGNWTTANIWQNNTIPSTNSYVVISKGDTVTIPANTTVTAATLYDAGMLKFLGNAQLQMSALGVNGKPALQTIDYSYNVRSQMRGVNLDANDNPQVSQDKLFSYKIDYHEDGRYFDGSISKMTWKSSPLTPSGGTGTRSYTYSYDRANRLLNSQYSGVGNENYSVSNSYDANGNLLTLQRYGKTGTNTFGLIDNLTYSYISTGNKLQKVDDAVAGNIFANDFRDVAGNDYDYSVDGKMTKDGNKGITSIRYNFLDLVSSIKFASNDSVSYWYSSTGKRIQRKVVKSGQPDSYTIYDGEMVYTYTGASPSLAGFGIGEIQTPEGRYVNGKLEYGYTDHVGNLRLSYKDSLGVAFITQSQHYDPWSNVNAGSEYQLAGIQGDRYLVSGKETDNLTGNILLDWRDYDSVTGRMNSFDPADQSQMLSGFAYCGNNPIMRVDPDGRFSFVPFLMATLFTGHISGMISQSNGGSYGKGFVTGALGGAAGYFAPIGFLPGLGYGAGTGAAIGGINSSINGGNFWDGALSGGITGGILGGISGGLGALRKNADFWTGYRAPHAYEAINGLSKGKRVPYTDKALNNAVNKLKSVRPNQLSGIYRAEKWTPRGWKVEGGNLVGNIDGELTNALAITVPRTWMGGNSYNISVAPNAFSSQESLLSTLIHEYGHVAINVSPYYAASRVKNDHSIINNAGHASIYKMEFEFARINGYSSVLKDYSSVYQYLGYYQGFDQDIDNLLQKFLIKIK
jgi:RHS repeat-associated protein